MLYADVLLMTMMLIPSLVMTLMMPLLMMTCADDDVNAVAIADASDDVTAEQYRSYYLMKLQYLTAQEFAHGRAVRIIQAAVRGRIARKQFAPLVAAYR